MAVEIIRSGIPSFQGVLDLYRAETDSNHANWNGILSIAYANPYDAFFDETKAYWHALRAVELGDGNAAHNLGLDWLNGLYGRVDLEKAKFWFAKGNAMGNGDAASKLYELLIKEPRYWADSAFRAAADEVLAKSLDMNGCLRNVLAIGRLKGDWTLGQQGHCWRDGSV